MYQLMIDVRKENCTTARHIYRELCYSVSPKCTNQLGTEHSVPLHQGYGMN